MEYIPTMNKVGACDHQDEIDVSSTPTQITISAGKNSLEIANVGDNDIYYGGSGVSSADGMILFRGSTKAWTHVKESFSVYVVCAAGETSKLRVVEYE